MKYHFILFFLLVSAYGCNSKEHLPREINHKKVSLLAKGEDRNYSFSERKKYLDSALLLTTDTLNAEILYSKSKLHFSVKEYDSMYFLEKALKKTPSALSIARYYHLLGYYHENITSNLDSAYYFHRLSEDQFRKINDSSGIGRRLLRIAVIERLRKDNFGAKETLTSALSYFDKAKDKNHIASVYNELAINHSELLNTNDAITYHQKAIEITENKDDFLIFKNNLAVEYKASGNIKEALLLFNELFMDSTLKENKKNYARVLHNHTFSRWLNGEQNLDSLLLKALSIRKNNHDKKGQIGSYTDLGEYYAKTNIPIAKKNLDTAIQLSKKIKAPKAEIDALKILMALEPKNTFFKDRYIFLKDSLYRQELKAKTQFAKMKYDDTQKKETIKNLTLDKDIKNLEIEKQKNQKMISILLGIIIVLLGVFLFYYLKQRHKKDTLKEVYTTETRISQKVHDELANDIYHVINKIQNLPDAPKTDVVNKLENIYRKTRDISYENGTINLEDDYFYQELKALLGAYQNSKTKISAIGLNNAVFKTVKDHQKIVVSRILQELMTNMKKHSNATNVVLTFKKDKNQIFITYIDNGTGLKKTSYFKGNGLKNVENRIKNINGNLNFDVNRKSGVGISISFPI